MIISLNAGKLFISVLFYSFPWVLTCSSVWNVFLHSSFSLTPCVCLYILGILATCSSLEGVASCRQRPVGPSDEIPPITLQMFQGHPCVGCMHLPILDRWDCCRCAGRPGWLMTQLAERSGHDCCGCINVYAWPLVPLAMKPSNKYSGFGGVCVWLTGIGATNKYGSFKHQASYVEGKLRKKNMLLANNFILGERPTRSLPPWHQPNLSK